MPSAAPADTLQPDRQPRKLAEAIAKFHRAAVRRRHILWTSGKQQVQARCGSGYSHIRLNAKKAALDRLDDSAKTPPIKITK